MWYFISFIVLLVVVKVYALKASIRKLNGEETKFDKAVFKIASVVGIVFLAGICFDLFIQDKDRSILRNHLSFFVFPEKYIKKAKVAHIKICQTININIPEKELDLFPEKLRQKHIELSQKIIEGMRTNDRDFEELKTLYLDWKQPKNITNKK